MTVALLTAAGSGTRMGQDIPKQFIHVDNKPVIIHTMEAFQKHPSVDAIMVVTIPSWIEVVKAYAKQFNISKLRWVVAGGKTGQESIYNGLKSLENEIPSNSIVMIMMEIVAWFLERLYQIALLLFINTEVQLLQFRALKPFFVVMMMVYLP